MIDRERIIRAAADLVADPRAMEESIRDLGVDPESAILTLGELAMGAVAEHEEESGEELSDAERLHSMRLVLVGFALGLALGREAAHDEAPA